MPRILVGLISLLVSAGCTSSPGALAPCDSRSPDRLICGFTNPEDLGFLPGRSWLIVSEMAAAEANPDEAETPLESGHLTAIRIMNFESRRLYPTQAVNVDAVTAKPGWGDEACPSPPDPTVFKPHGIDVGHGPGGLPALAVVNHGGREAVEFFEIGSAEMPSLTWRGCVPMPDDVMANDVAFLPGGGFVVTNFMPAFDGMGPGVIWSMLKISLGARTGSVLKWEPGGALTEIENSEGSAPNGVEVSADGTEIFVAEWGGKSIYRLRLDAEGTPGRDEVEVDHHPDNLTWTRDGKLLVAGQEGGISASLGCSSIRGAGCDIGYSVYLLTPDGLEATKLIEGRGAASVALEVGDEIFVGAFIGDQILRVRRPD